jgi:hypothetical protein
VSMPSKKREIMSPERDGRFARGRIAAVVQSVHVLPKAGEGWTVRRMGGGRLSRDFSTQTAALRWARELARREDKTELIVHSRDGRVRTHHVTGPVAARQEAGAGPE